jgi:predicted transcriptional regulator
MSTVSTSHISVSLAKNIKKQRENLGISQDGLSKLAGVTLYAISKIESGATRDPRVVTVKRIATALSCGVDDLLG